MRSIASRWPTTATSQGSKNTSGIGPTPLLARRDGVPAMGLWSKPTLHPGGCRSEPRSTARAARRDPLISGTPAGALAPEAGTERASYAPARLVQQAASPFMHPVLWTARVTPQRPKISARALQFRYRETGHVPLPLMGGESALSRISQR